MTECDLEAQLRGMTLLPSNIAAGSGWVLDVIGNKIIGIYNEGTGVTRCDLKAQLRGMTSSYLYY